MDESRTPEQWNALGMSFQDGNDREKDPVKAAQCFKRAADRGLAEAQANLAMCYANGAGVARDMESAIHLFKAAAAQGDAFAMYSLGVCYYQGTGVTEGKLEAINWFIKAAELGNENASYNLETLNVKRCPTCKKWDTLYSQKIHNGMEDMVVCTNSHCPDNNTIFNATTRMLISGKKCPLCGRARTPLNAGSWICWNGGCPAYGKQDSRF